MWNCLLYTSGEDFDARVLAEVEVPVVKAKRLTLTARFMPLFKAAAVVAVVFSMGNVMQHSFFSDVEEVAALLIGIIQVVILGIGGVIVKLLVILGPFVFAVSMLPVFQKQLSIWFGTRCV